MPETSGAGARDTPATTTTNTAVSVIRRLHWHHILVRRRRWSRALDELLNGAVNPRDAFDWHAAHMDLDVQQRDQLGRALLAAGWLPR